MSTSQLSSRLHVVPAGCKVNAMEWQKIVECMNMSAAPVLIIDNAPSHSAAANKKYYGNLETAVPITIIFQPPASPDLFDTLKSRVRDTLNVPAA